MPAAPPTKRFFIFRLAAGENTRRFWRGVCKTDLTRMTVGNAIMIIRPYRYSGTWVFDDPELGLRREPFVSGVPEMIDRLVRHIPAATGGFRLLFSASQFPGYQAAFERVRGDMGGTWYRNRDEPQLEGWLCPALLKYFAEAPEVIYAKAEPAGR